MNDQPPPLVPAEVDLRGMPFMPLDVIRLLDSDLFALSSGDEFKAAVALWCKAWQQTPAGSLPTDDRVLAHLSGAAAKWQKVKAMALRGWIVCDDGRYYHELIADKALEAWEHRLKHRERMDRNADKLRQWRERKLLQDASSNPSVTVTEPVSKEVTKPLRNLLESDSDSKAKRSDSEVTENLKEQKVKRVPRDKREAPPPKTRIPIDFSVSDRVRKWAASKGYEDLEAHLEIFVGKVRANGYTYIDWDDAFMACIREDWGKLRGQVNGRGTGGGVTPEQLQKLMAEVH